MLRIPAARRAQSEFLVAEVWIVEYRNDEVWLIAAQWQYLVSAILLRRVFD
jgi:hypothetical protein